ncbi:hypothetical protein BUALT_Bualt03G0114100 [Buddleja alternifolia]|uniref:SURP motif domain-containing protein n=1 Tax=Buddleja alternifolia TaxID=168488 RepID=A0AAV6Y1A7_9LAMI|nr:hypothetical protein BUALT_Bualt03G0114100 [Buddleja alternifolia]
MLSPLSEKSNKEIAPPISYCPKLARHLNATLGPGIDKKRDIRSPQNSDAKRRNLGLKKSSSWDSNLGGEITERRSRLTRSPDRVPTLTHFPLLLLHLSSSVTLMELIIVFLMPLPFTKSCIYIVLICIVMEFYDIGLKVEELDGGKDDLLDPLRATDGKMEVPIKETQNINSETTISDQLRAEREWSSFKKILMQRFPVSKTSPISMVVKPLYSVSGVFMKGNKGELDDDKRFNEEDARVISQQECLSKLQELKEEINQSWRGDDRVTSLRLSIKVARLLMDASVIQFYPTLFVLATDIMDMLGDLVWSRIKQKAEITEEGRFICSLPDNFKEGDICFDAKETCYNWFSKIGSVHELLPRIYLELAILPCWRFLHEHPGDILQRLVMMTRGIADPLASAYCRLYLVQCTQRLPPHDTGYLVTCINDLKVLLMRLISPREALLENLPGNSKLLLTLIEPTIEYIMRCLFKDLKQNLKWIYETLGERRVYHGRTLQEMEIHSILVALGMGRNPSILFENCSCIAIILHHILKDLPIGFICSNAVELLHVIECTDDFSFDQFLNFKLLGHRLCEKIPEVSRAHSVVDKIMQVLSCYDNLDAYLTVADAYLDIILENQVDTLVNIILDGIFERAREEKIGEDELVILKSIFVKFLSHFGNIENILALNHFVDILDMTHGTSRNSINMHILSMGMRNGNIQDPIVIGFLFEVAQALYDGVDFSNLRKDDYQHPAHVISRFVSMVDYGKEVESHLRFLAQCRGAFASISELQELLVHSSNNLAVRAMRDRNSNISFVKSCLAFNEVTIPAIPTNLRQLNLYLETAEVALLGGFVSHSDGLIDAAVNCLRNVGSDDGLRMAEEVDGIISLICKLCGMLVMVPGNLQHGVGCIPKCVLSLHSQSWMSPEMTIKVFTTVIFLLAALSQNQLMYHAVNREVIGNDQLFFGVQSYPQELLSLSGGVLQDIVNIIMQEPSMVIRGKIAVEACNCIASSFTKADMDLEVVGRHALLFDDDGAAKFVNSGDALVEWHSLQIDRYDVRHLLSAPPPSRRLNRSSDPIPSGDLSLEIQLDHERYLDLPSHSDQPDIEEDEQQSDTVGYRAVAFSYGNTDDPSEQKSTDDVMESSRFIPPFPIPEHLSQSLPPTEKVHQIIARTALFVSKHGGQSEIILRVKQGDNPTFGFLMPGHYLHAYFRFLVEHPELLHSQFDGKSQDEGKKVDSEHNNSNTITGSLSLLGSIYGSGEEEEGNDTAKTEKDVSQDNVGNVNHTSSDSLKKMESQANATKDEPVPKKPILSNKDKVLTVKKNSLIAASKSGSVKSKEEKSQSFSAAADKAKSSAMGGTSKIEPLIIEPPTELKRLIDKIVEFIMRNGKHFEATLIEQDRKHGRFPFLLPSNQYHSYYLKILQTAQESKVNSKSSYTSKDATFAACDMPIESDRKEKFKMVIGRSKKESQETESNGIQEESGITVDAAAAAAILQAATRGIKNSNMRIINSSSPPSRPDNAAEKSDQNENHDVSTVGEADSSEAHLTKEKNLKAERLKRAKMFVAMLKSGEVPFKTGTSRGSSLEPQESGGKEREGSLAPADVERPCTGEKPERNYFGEEHTERHSKRKYRSRSGVCEDDDEDGDGDMKERDDRRRSRKKTKSRSRCDEDDENETAVETEHKRRKRRHHSHSSSAENEDEGESSEEDRDHKHHKRSRKKHHSRHSSRERSRKRHSSKKYSHEEDEDDDDEGRDYKHSRKKHHSRRSSHRSRDKHGHRNRHSSRDRKSRQDRKHDSSSNDEHLDSSCSGKHKKEMHDERDDLEEGEISSRVSGESRGVASGHITRETSTDVSFQQRAPFQPSETTAEVPDDLRAKIRAMLMATRL